MSRPIFIAESTGKMLMKFDENPVKLVILLLRFCHLLLNSTLYVTFIFQEVN